MTNLLVRAQLLQVVMLLERHPDLRVINVSISSYVSVDGAEPTPTVQLRTLAPLIAAYPGVALRAEIGGGLHRHMLVDGVDFVDIVPYTPEQLSTLAAQVSA